MDYEGYEYPVDCGPLNVLPEFVLRYIEGGFGMVPVIAAFALFVLAAIVAGLLRMGWAKRWSVAFGLIALLCLMLAILVLIVRYSIPTLCTDPHIMAFK